MTDTTTKGVISELDETTAALLNVISLFTQEQFNKVPFEGSWTAAQVCGHVLKSETNIPHVWEGSTRPTTERKPDENVEKIKGIFLDYSTKMKSPEFILPSDTPKDKQEMYNSLKDNRAEIRRLAAVKDLTLTYTAFSFPIMGELTGIEWAVFAIAHSKRHIHQLKDIYEKVKG